MCNIFPIDFEPGTLLLRSVCFTPLGHQGSFVLMFDELYLCHVQGAVVKTNMVVREKVCTCVVTVIIAG